MKWPWNLTPRSNRNPSFYQVSLDPNYFSIWIEWLQNDKSSIICFSDLNRSKIQHCNSRLLLTFPMISISNFKQYSRCRQLNGTMIGQEVNINLDKSNIRVSHDLCRELNGRSAFSCFLSFVLKMRRLAISQKIGFLC